VEPEARIRIHLDALKIKPGVTFVMRDAGYEPTGEYFVCCDVGLFVGHVDRNASGTRVLTGDITPWGAVTEPAMRSEGLLSEEGPYKLTVTVAHPKFDVTWTWSRATSMPNRDRDELAAFGAEVLRRTTAVR